MSQALNSQYSKASVLDIKAPRHPNTSAGLLLINKLKVQIHQRQREIIRVYKSGIPKRRGGPSDEQLITLHTVLLNDRPTKVFEKQIDNVIHLMSQPPESESKGAG